MNEQAGIGLPSFGGSTSSSSSATASASSPASGSERKADAKSELELPRRREPDPKEARVQVPLDLTVTCGRDGVTIHPGGYRRSLKSLKKDGTLKQDLETIVRNYQLIDQMVTPRPRIEFLIEPGGGETYQIARNQTVLAALGWPVTIRVVESSAPRLSGGGRY
jgi:hypothetical protein